MRRGSRVSFGPGAASLILIVVILSLSVLGILALMNARNDSQLSRRSVEVVAAGYALNDRAEHALASLDAVAANCAAVKTSAARGISRTERRSSAIPSRMDTSM